MAEKRVARRIITRVKTIYGPEAPRVLGFGLNLSAEGIFLSGSQVFRPGVALRLRLEPIGSTPIELRGTVRWAQRVPPALASVVKPGMGVRIEEPTRHYLDFFSRLVRLSPRRAAPRVDAHLEVRFYRREQLVKEYTENISQGGLFVATGEAFAPGDEITVDLVIPDLATVWRVGGRVAYRLDAEKAARLETSEGVGVEITLMDPGVKEALDAYVQTIIRLYDLPGEAAP